MQLTPRRGRPRDAAVDERILDAAWTLLRAAGYAGLSVDELAGKAEVAKTTVYRRWPTKEHLAVAVVARMLGEVPIADTGDLRADLATFAAALAAQLSKARAAGLERGIERSAGLMADLTAAAARHADIGEAVRAGYARRHAMAMARLNRAAEAGQLKDGIDPGLLVEQVAGRSTTGS